MGLPLPGFTKLAELPIRPIREFVNKTYAGQWKGYKSGPGLNTTWAASQTLPVLATEIILRTNAHVAAYSHRGDFTLSPAEKAKLRETLAVAYGLSLAMSTSKTVVMAIAGERSAGVAPRELCQPHPMLNVQLPGCPRQPNPIRTEPTDLG